VNSFHIFKKIALVVIAQNVYTLRIVLSITIMAVNLSNVAEIEKCITELTHHIDHPCHCEGNLMCRPQDCTCPCHHHHHKRHHDSTVTPQEHKHHKHHHPEETIVNITIINEATKTETVQVADTKVVENVAKTSVVENVNVVETKVVKSETPKPEIKRQATKVAVKAVPKAAAKAAPKRIPSKK
jgi:hypothetical protein